MSYEVDDILCVGLGGTIGMFLVQPAASEIAGTGGSILAPRGDANTDDLLRRLFLKQYVMSRKIHLVSLSIANLDSNDINQPYWTKLTETIVAECLKKRRQTGQGYRGVLVTHGTDTEEFTAAAQAHAFGPDLNIPIIFVSAQSHADVQTGDARTNLSRGLAVIAETDQVGVMAICGNGLYAGHRFIKANEKGYNYLETDTLRGEFVAGALNVRVSIRRAPEKPEFNTEDIQTGFADNILGIRAYPGTRPDPLIKILGDYNGLTIIPNGAGNLPGIDVYSYENLLKAAQKQNVPVLVPSPFAWGDSDDSHYAAGQIIKQTNAITVSGKSASAAFVMFSAGIDAAQKKLANGSLQDNQLCDFVRNYMDHSRFLTIPNIITSYPLEANKPVEKIRRPNKAAQSAEAG